MKVLRNLSAGLITALASSLLVVGALSLTLAETQFTAYPQPPSTLAAPNLTPLPTQAYHGTPIPPTATVYEIAPPPTTCPPPIGWSSYLIQPGDTLAQLALQRNISSEQIIQANCLLSDTLLPGTFLFLPAPISIPSNTPSLPPSPTLRPCGPPLGWTLYTIQPGQTLFGLSLEFGVSVYQIQQANCLNGTLIYSGQRIYLPNIPTRTHTLTASPTATPTLTPPLPTTIAPSLSPTITPSPTGTNTVEPTLTDTPTATDTNTPEPTITSTP
ncbi:MAG: LysM peptidoglycan-binding domain-containing protein [Anaerolinea sp.]|nr:LysM peptidoglycan-binding domain-containing protein [Anaerolinea sp.]